MMRVYMASVLPLTDEELFREKLAEVPEWRRQKVLTCREPIDRCRSLACGLLFEEGCRQAGWEPEIYEGAYGKPMLRADADRCGRPVSKQCGTDEATDTCMQHAGASETGRYFNLSHAGDYAAAAFSDRPVGIDVERCGRFTDASHSGQACAGERQIYAGEAQVCIGKRYNRMLRIARRILSEQEALIWQQMPDAGKESELVRIWTRKEAYAKMVGKGLAMDFAAIDTLREECCRTRRLDETHWISVCSEMLSHGDAEWNQMSL